MLVFYLTLHSLMGKLWCWG